MKMKIRYKATSRDILLFTWWLLHLLFGVLRILFGVLWITVRTVNGAAS